MTKTLKALDTTKLEHHVPITERGLSEIIDILNSLVSERNYFTAQLFVVVLFVYYICMKEILPIY